MPRIPQISNFIQIGKSAMNLLLGKNALLAAPDQIASVSGRIIDAAV
jgi:hypothetical protein